MIYILQFKFCPLTCMGNQSHPEGPGLHIMCPGKHDPVVQCKDVGNYSTCPKYNYFIGTLALKVSQILTYS